MKAKEIAIRGIRKSSSIANRALSRAERLTAKVESKTTKILLGSDLSNSPHKEISYEKAYYGGREFNICPLNPALPAVGRKGAVVLLIPSLTKASFYGGAATALIVAGLIAKKTKRKLRIYETLTPGGKDGLVDFYKSNGINISNDAIELIDVSARRYNIYGYIDLHPDDIHIASAWWDAHILTLLPLSRKFIYLIQDYEPIFYSNSDEYVMAENTYQSQKFIPLCNTKLMLDFMSNRYAYIKDNGLYFEPAVSRAKNGYSTKNSDKKIMFLYGRPNVKRNLFYTAIQSINNVLDSNKLDPKEWEVYMAGQDKLPNISLTNGNIIKNLGKMDIDDYYNFAKSVDLTISLMMAPHPNYPTLEMSSIGSAVVSTKYENKQDLSNYSNNIFMAELNHADIERQIINASRLSYEKRIENAKKSKITQNWELALANSVENILRVI